jgi:drug/metabolite transporter (DMT)-like permease
VKTPSGALHCAIAMIILGASVPVSGLLLDYPVLTGQAGRYALAALVFAVLLRVRGTPFVAALSARDWVRLGLLTASGLVAFNLLLLTALRHADAAVVGTIVGGTPLVLSLAGPLTQRRLPAARVVLAAVIVICGGLMVHGAGHTDGIGVLAALGTMVCEVLFSLLALPLLPRLGPLRVSALTCTMAVPFLAVTALITGEKSRLRLPTGTETLGYAYVGGMLTVVAFVWWYTGLRRLGPERAGLFVGLLPPVSLLTAALLDGTVPSVAALTGVIVVGLGLALGLYPQKRSRVGTAVVHRGGQA